MKLNEQARKRIYKDPVVITLLLGPIVCNALSESVHASDPSNFFNESRLNGLASVLFILWLAYLIWRPVIRKPQLKYHTNFGIAARVILTIIVIILSRTKIN